MDLYKPEFHEFEYDYENRITGFPSPARDFRKPRLSLDKKLINNPDASFYAQIVGDTSASNRFDEGDILVIDRSIIPRHNHMAVCYLNNEFVIRRIHKEKEVFTLVSEDDKISPVTLEDGDILEVWGVVTHVVKSLL